MLWPAAKAEEGQTIRVIFREVDQLSNRLILSQKQVFQAELLKSINVGDMVEGTISWIEPYGAFCSVDVTDAKHQISGLIRKSELSWKQVVRPESVVEVGAPSFCPLLPLRTHTWYHPVPAHCAHVLCYHSCRSKGAHADTPCGPHLT